MEKASQILMAAHSAIQHVNVAPGPKKGETTTPSFKIKVTPDVPYQVLVDANGKSRHHERHHLNVAVPVDLLASSPTGLLPVVMHVHGGGWKRAIAEKLGCISVVISYRVGERFPAHAEDVASAIAWVYKNIPDFGGDLERFFLTGHSAGAHLVSLIALDAQYVNAVGVPITFIKGVASISGIYTLSHPMDGGFNGWTNWAYRKVYIHGTFGDVVKDWELASPITYVRKVAAEILKDKSGAAESAPAPAPSSVVSGSSAATSSIETPLSPPREQKDELLTEFGDPLASPRRVDEDDGTKQANDEQRELLETATPPIVSVIGSYKDAANNAEHLTVDLIGSKNHYVPPFLVINAESDLGLEYDGRVFFTALGDAGLIAEYASIPTTNHASVTKSYATVEKIRDFIRRTINQLNGLQIDDLEIL